MSGVTFSSSLRNITVGRLQTVPAGHDIFIIPKTRTFPSGAAPLNDISVVCDRAVDNSVFTNHKIKNIYIFKNSAQFTVLYRPNLICMQSTDIGLHTLEDRHGFADLVRRLVS